VAEVTFPIDVAIIGDCGRLGLPLGLAFADRGLNVLINDRMAIRSRQTCPEPALQLGDAC
jgi:hypothetical protein